MPSNVNNTIKKNKIWFGPHHQDFVRYEVFSIIPFDSEAFKKFFLTFCHSFSSCSAALKLKLCQLMESSLPANENEKGKRHKVSNLWLFPIQNLATNQKNATTEEIETGSRFCQNRRFGKGLNFWFFFCFLHLEVIQPYYGFKLRANRWVQGKPQNLKKCSSQSGVLKTPDPLSKTSTRNSTNPWKLQQVWRNVFFLKFLGVLTGKNNKQSLPRW